MTIHLFPSDNFDRALSLIRDPNTEFVLKKGEKYSTSGNWNITGHSSAPKCKIYGNGARLILENPVKSWNGTTRGNRDLGVLWVGDDSTVEDIILDGNEKVHGDPDPAKSWYVSQGLWCDGKLTAKGVVVENIRGAYSTPNSLSGSVEAFGIGTNKDVGGSNLRDCVVQNCPEDSYISCFSLGHDNLKAERSTVMNCTVNIGRNNWFGFGVNCNVDIIDCNIIKGVRNAVYNDTGITSGIRIINSRFFGIDKVLSLVVPNNAFPANKQNILFRDSLFRFSSGAERHLVELWDKHAAPSVMGPVYFIDCTAECEIGTKLYVACAGKDLRNVSLIGTKTTVPLVNTIGDKLVIL